MDNRKDFDTILDECLDRVFRGENLEACLADYPDHAADLRPLLETVVETKDAADIAPRPEFRQEAARQFQQALRDLPVRKPAGAFSFRHWWVSVATALAVIVFGGTGTVFAANSAQPDNILYPVKLATESVRISLASSDQAKAELYAEFADRRVSEIVTMASKGNAEAVEKATDHLDHQLVAMAGVVDTGESKELATMASTADHGALTAPMASTTTDTSGAALAVPAPAPATTATTATEPTPTEPPMALVPGRGPSAADNQTRNAEGHGPDEFGTAATAPAGSFKEDVSNRAAEAIQKLQEAIENTPETAHGGLRHAIDVVQGGYGKVLDDLK
jgi:hypothetical protein